MHKRIIVGTFVLVLLICLLSCIPAHTDGMKFPPSYVTKLPEIPHQEALITYRDGIETLVISSSIDGEGDRFGWIVPVPNPPTEIKTVPKSLFTVLRAGFSERIYSSKYAIDYEYHGSYRTAILFILVLSAMAICHWLRVRFDKKIFSDVGYVLFVLFFLFGVLFSPPVVRYIGTESAGSTDTVSVLSQEIIGDYEVSVLKATNPLDLSDWLSNNGYRALDESMEYEAQHYIDNHWCFVTAKLVRQLSTTHAITPLSLTFPTGVAAYPMRITR